MSGLRYFRVPLAAYQVASSQLDAAYGYPNPETKTERTLRLVDELPQDAEGRVYLAVSAEFCEYDLPSQIIASGAVEEIAAQIYWAMFPPRPGAW
jgi:hypothetical protein